MKNVFSALAILIIGIPVILRSMADGSIDLNGIVLNTISTVQELVTRQESDWASPTEPQQPAQQPAQEDNSQL